MSEIQQIAGRLRAFAVDRDWERFHTPKNLAMALAGEAGEVLAEFQWLTADESEQVMVVDHKAEAVRDELADVAIYLIRLADVLDIDLTEAIGTKLDRNKLRFSEPGAAREEQTGP